MDILFNDFYPLKMAKYLNQNTFILHMTIEATLMVRDIKPFSRLVQGLAHEGSHILQARLDYRAIEEGNPFNSFSVEWYRRFTRNQPKDTTEGFASEYAKFDYTKDEKKHPSVSLQGEVTVDSIDGLLVEYCGAEEDMPEGIPEQIQKGRGYLSPEMNEALTHIVVVPELPVPSRVRISGPRVNYYEKSAEDVAETVRAGLRAYHSKDPQLIAEFLDDEVLREKLAFASEHGFVASEVSEHMLDPDWLSETFETRIRKKN